MVFIAFLKQQTEKKAHNEETESSTYFNTNELICN